MLSNGAHVNFYMFHGGTNFGFYNGANGNFGAEYNPTITTKRKMRKPLNTFSVPGNHR